MVTGPWQGGSAREGALGALAEVIHGCSACERLVAWRNEVALAPPRSHRGQSYWARPLSGFGDPAARLVVVGLAPAAHGGNRTGRMFTGDRSGDFLFAALHRHGLASQAASVGADDGLELRGCYVTAPVRCAPPANRPLSSERDRCLPYLEEELSLLSSARAYLALGAFAFDALGRTSAFRPHLKGRSFAHGAEVAAGPGAGGAGERTVLCSYHPSQRNVFTGLLTSEMFSSVVSRAKELAGLQGREAGCPSADRQR